MAELDLSDADTLPGFPLDEDAAAPFDVAGRGPRGHTIIADAPEHPDRRIPFVLGPRFDVERGASIEQIDPRGLVP